MGSESKNEIVARLILSTKRKKREYSLDKIATDLIALQKLVGMKEASRLIGISSGMINQFLSVFKLSPFVLQLVKSRAIDSVAFIHNLSKFNYEDQEILARMGTESKIKTQDLKILVPYRKQYPNEPLEKLIDRIETSKNIKISVIKIPLSVVTNKDGLIEEIENLIGKQNLLAVENNGDHLDIKLTKEGERILKSNAKERNISFTELITQLL